MSKVAKIWEEHGNRSTEILRDLAGNHVSGRIELLPDDQDAHPYQGYGQFYPRIELPPGVLTDTASSASSDFKGMLEQLRADNEKLGVISAMGEWLKEGKSGVVLSPHEKIIEPGFIEAAVSIILAEEGYTFKNGLVVSKLLGHLAYKLYDDSPAAPTVPIMQMAGDAWMTFPPSSRMKASGLERVVTGYFNDFAKWRIGRTMKQGGYLLFLAGSGETDKPAPDDTNTIILARAQDGTLEMTDGYMAFGAAANLETGQMGIASTLSRLSKVSGTVHDIMEQNSRWLNERVSPRLGKNYIYQRATVPE
ncbi:MAG: hypothetical protein M3Q70_00940 [bacterium]|nr:hypothetical protein [bacterium]